MAIVATALLAVGVGALALAALQRTDAAAPVGSAAPAPTFTFGEQATGSPSPTETDAAPDAVSAAATERFIAVDGAEVWRATAGACGSADAAPVAPVVEYSTDGGATWQVVTPPDVRQVLNVAVFGVGQGGVIAATGDACEPAALRTYTAGRAWESYPQVLATSTYVSPTDRASVVTGGAAVAAPCADARSARTSRGTTGIVCDGTAYVLSDGQWTALVGGAVALDAVAGTIVAAHVSDACPGGVTVTRFSDAPGEQLGCVTDVDASAPAAISVLGSDLVFWSADTVRPLS